MFQGGQRQSEARREDRGQKVRTESLRRPGLRSFGGDHRRSARASVALFAVILVFGLAGSARAQHGDWLLGSFALQGGQQPPEGLAYQNLFSYYHASGNSFVSVSGLKCAGPACVNASLNANGSLDLFIDAHVFSYVSRFKLFGANYGFSLIVPFAIVDASGAGSLEPDLSLPASTIQLSSASGGGGATKGSIGDIYVEPVNFGWHLNHLDLVVSSGFLAPSGPYNSDAKLNVGFGHWTGVFGLGGIIYADKEKTWALSMYSHYLMYASQIGRDYTLGDAVPFEWGASKTFKPNLAVLKEATIGAAGYAQWQVANNSIGASPTTQPGIGIVNALSTTKSRVYAAGPAINLVTTYGLFSVRWYEEFGAQATPSGHQLMFSLTLPLPIRAPF